MQVLEGKRKKEPGGEYDAHIVMLQRFNMPQTVVDAQDADYIEEAMVFLDALATVEKRQAKRRS